MYLVLVLLDREVINVYLEDPYHRSQRYHDLPPNKPTLHDLSFSGSLISLIASISIRVCSLVSTRPAISFQPLSELS
jgi:hypothetical protein